MTPEEGQQRLERSEAMLQDLDANHNGLLDGDEVSGRRKYYVERILQRAGMEPNYPVTINKVREGLARAYQVSASVASPQPPAAANPTAQPGEPAASPAAPLVPGFGVATTLQPPGGFGLPTAAASEAASEATAAPAATSTSPLASSPSRPSAPSGGTTPEASKPSDDQRYRDYAKGLLAKYDKNKNGVLEKDECAEMSNNPKGADLNGDGAVSLDELTAWLVEQGQKSSGGRSTRSEGRSKSRSSESTGDRSRSSSDTGGDRSRSTESSADRSRGDGEKKRTVYRLRTERDRLPSGLPDWFLRKDMDGDGQISMREYSSEWSDAKAADFARYDLNGDGVITAAECLKVEKPAKK